jgi:hypothetical protein
MSERRPLIKGYVCGGAIVGHGAAALLQTQREVVATDELRSYGAALREIGFSGLHEQELRANNRVQNSRQPLRRRERKSARLQISQIGSALCFCRRGRLQYIPRATAFDRPADP